MIIESTDPIGDAIATMPENTDGEDQAASAREAADVKVWLKRIKEAREFDKNARSAYALNRRYARADRTRFEVTVPIALSYIDVLKSFLYAQNPDCSVTPSSFTEPPPQKEIAAMVADQMSQGQQAAGPALPSSMAKLLGTQGGQPPSPMLPGGPPPGVGPMPPGPPQQLDINDPGVMAKVAEVMAPYQRVRDDTKQFGQTLEIVVTYLWDRAKLKDQAKPMVGSALTVATGWFKAVWLERMGKDPIMMGQINDIHAKLARLGETRREIDAGEGDDDQLKAQLEQQAKDLDAQSDVMLARGFAVDFIRAENIQVSTDCADMSAYLDASWVAQQDFITVGQAKTDYPGLVGNGTTTNKLTSATCYYPQKPRDVTKVNDAVSASGEDVRAEEAEAYHTGSGSTGSSMDTTGESYICRWELWDRDNGVVRTMIEGVEAYAVEPYAPEPDTTRFYPFFQFQIGCVDGERHPRSLITRSEKLFDEYDRTRSQFAEHRRRCKPKTAFDASNLDQTEANKLADGAVQEMVGIKPTKPGTPMNQLLAPVTYAPIDPALYDTAPIRAELEMIWGVQEALSSSIHVAKTATEAEISKEGTNSRTGYMRDGLDAVFDDLAQYTAEVAINKMTDEDVRQIAGPWALWPQGMTIDDMSALVTVKIEAGSTGKPDTSAQRQAWGAIMPVLQQGIQEIGKLRGSSPDEIADCLEELIAETINRSGDRADANRFLPDPPRVPPPPPKGPSQPLDESALAGPQIQQLLAILVDVRAGALTPPSAIALIKACAPSVPQELIEGMVNGAKPQPGDPATQLDAPHASTMPPPSLPLPFPPQGQ